jgi:glycerophosphoryl diester phosphodiesterase
VLDDVAPEVATGWLVWNIDDAAAVIGQTVDGRHAAIHPHHGTVTPELNEAAHAAGLTVNTWTCNDPDRIRWLAESRRACIDSADRRSTCSPSCSPLTTSV